MSKIQELKYKEFINTIEDEELQQDLIDFGSENFFSVPTVDIVYRYFPNIDDRICDKILCNYTIINTPNIDSTYEEFFIKKQIVWFYDSIKVWTGLKGEG